MNRVEALQNRWSTEQLMAGSQLTSWLKVLQTNDFDVHPAYWHRAAWVTALSLPASILGHAEDAIYGRQIADMDVDPDPIFILGHWRSGTTHLHNLLGRDPAHTSSTLWQVVFPGSMILTGGIGPRLLKGMLPEKRTYDNVALGWHEFAEDEIAIAKLTGMSLYAGFMFPDQASKYERYIDFLECTDAERRRWKHALEYMIKKIMIATGGKRVIIKSCPHSARIRMILEMYPNARFLHIHRNPYETFASMLHMRGKVDWENFLQRPQKNFLDQRWDQTAIIGKRVYERLIEDRHLIPPENLIEIPYADFAGNELEWLEKAYTQLRFPEWERYKRVITPYLDSLKGFQRNKLTIDPELQAFVYDQWRIVFDTYGYSKDYR